MNSPTRSFQTFSSGLAKARKIVSRVPLSFPTTVAHELKVRALILLSHSAIEEYIEDISKEVCDQSLRNFNATGVVNVPLYSLVAYHKSSLAEAFRYPSNSVSFKQAFTAGAMEARDKHLKLVDDNNGIKQKNCNSLLFPIGLFLDEVDGAIFPTLDSFAHKRGGVAHGISIQVTHTRSDIQSDLSLIHTLLKSIDEAACSAYADYLQTL